MSDQDSGDKTEQPTAKKLLDARKKGDVPKSRDLTSTMTLLVWLSVGAIALPGGVARLSALMQQVLDSIQQPFSYAAPAMGWLALEALLWVIAVVSIPVVVVGWVVEFLQTGPVFSTDKVAPKMEHLNPVEGIKKMFSMTNLVEVLKAAIKTAALFLIGWLVLKSLMPQVAQLSGAAPATLGTALWKITQTLLLWTLGVFAMVSVLDIAWQRHSFTKKMRMSLDDIKKEMKESEGDPHIKAQRKQAHQEWSQRNSAQAAANANVLVVNPTHVAIAIDYDREACPVPTLSAKGEDEVALAMREAAQAAGVPIVRNIALARDMLARVEEGELIPQDLFEVMADVILWAQQVRQEVEQHIDPTKAPANTAGQKMHRAPPGEDLTRYPDSFRRPQ